MLNVIQCCTQPQVVDCISSNEYLFSDLTIIYSNAFNLSKYPRMRLGSCFEQNENNNQIMNFELFFWGPVMLLWSHFEHTMY